MIIQCPKCSSTKIDDDIESGLDYWVEEAKCNECGYNEVDHKIGGVTNCRCPRCASNEVKIDFLSAQSGNTGWVNFSCNKCGFKSESVDDQSYESTCEWYEPSKYPWIEKIRKDRREFFGKIRGIINFITAEIEKIPTSKKTKEQVLNICNDIWSKVIGNVGEIDDEKLIAELIGQLARFDRLISELENNENEKTAYMLLITHVADMFALIGKERQKKI